MGSRCGGVERGAVNHGTTAHGLGYGVDYGTWVVCFLNSTDRVEGLANHKPPAVAKMAVSLGGGGAQTRLAGKPSGVRVGRAKRAQHRNSQTVLCTTDVACCSYLLDAYHLSSSDGRCRNKRLGRYCIVFFSLVRFACCHCWSLPMRVLFVCNRESVPLPVDHQDTVTATHLGGKLESRESNQLSADRHQADEGIHVS